MNINKIRERPERLSFKTSHIKAVPSPSGDFNFPGLLLPNPEEPKLIIKFSSSLFLSFVLAALKKKLGAAGTFGYGFSPARGNQA